MTDTAQRYRAFENRRAMHTLMSQSEVRHAWFRISGEKLSRARIWQIEIRALEKLRKGLLTGAREYFDDPTIELERPRVSSD